MYRHHPSLTGSALQADIDATPEIRPAYIDELVLEESVVMVAAAPGQGKSCLLLTMVTQASLGLPVFGELRCPRPLTTYIFCPERSAKELKERLKKVQRAKPANLSNIIFDDGMTGLVDINNPKSVEALYKEMDSHKRQIDIFCVEGLYGMTRLPLADEETANIFYRFHADLMSKFGCSIWESHHTKKIQRNWKGEELPAEWFGSQFLMANVTGAYLFQRLPAQFKSQLLQGKDTVSGMANEIYLTFDPETFTLSMDPTSPHVTAQEKFRIFVNGCFRDGKSFTYADLAAISGVSQSTITRAIMTMVKNGAILNVNSPGQKGLYKVVTLV